MKLTRLEGHQLQLQHKRRSSTLTESETQVCNTGVALRASPLKLEPPSMQGPPPSVFARPVFAPLCSLLMCLLLFGKTCMKGTHADFHGRLPLVMFSPSPSLYPPLIIFPTRSPLALEPHSLLPRYLQVHQSSLWFLDSYSFQRPDLIN